MSEMQKSSIVRLRYNCCTLPFFLLTALTPLDFCPSSALALFGQGKNRSPKQHQQHQNDDIRDSYDLVIIGAGASGLFASGGAASFGLKTLLLDQGESFVGGDCSNAACVPSKALRSLSRMATTRKAFPPPTDNSLLVEMARNHTFETVRAVRQREDIGHFESVPNLDLLLVQSTKFLSSNQLEILPRQEQNGKVPPPGIRIVHAKKFLIATGASPIVPPDLERAAKLANLPLYTYRDVLSPESNHSIWEQLLLRMTHSDNNNNTSSNNNNNDTGRIIQKIVIAGGGPTALELGQSLARLNVSITIVAPTLLADEDISLQQAACEVLRNDKVHLVLGTRVVNVCTKKNSDSADREKVVVLDDGTNLVADAMILCLGRRPTVESLQLDAANIAWDKDSGIIVHRNSLRSRTNPRVFACGDCCSAVTGKDRKAAHGAWTGYHAIRNIAVPRVLWAGSTSAVHPTVPSVTYTDPEMASVGLTRSDCIQKYGQDGFIYQSIREEGNDRADMERNERFVRASFVELRAARISGRILGLTACGPAAAELSNEIGLAIQNKLTVRDLARSIHSYPSHGYLLYRLALSMALSSTRGFLDTLGPVGRTLGKLYGGISVLGWSLRPNNTIPWKRKPYRRQRQWEALGQRSSLIVPSSQQGSSHVPISFLDYCNSDQYLNEDPHSPTFQEWMNSQPKLN